MLLFYCMYMYPEYEIKYIIIIIDNQFGLYLCVTLGPNLFMSMTIFNLLLRFNYVLCVKETFAFLFFLIQ